MTLHSPDVAQDSAIRAGEGLVRIAAGAGTGKTHVLAHRTVDLIENKGAIPERILATTFTVDAAREMKERIVQVAGDAGKAVNVCTLHSVASRILRRHWRVAGFSGPDYLIADDGDVEALMAEAIVATGMFPSELPAGDDGIKAEYDLYLKTCGARISRWKDNGLTEERASDPHRDRRNAEDEDAVRVYLAYQRAMRDRNMVDFADMTIRAVDLLRTRPDVAARECGSYDWILVDEGQDLNLVQIQMLRILSSRCLNLTVVGDDDQSLYSFRGAARTLMRRLPDLFPEARDKAFADVALTVNRRCTDEILAAANALVDWNARPSPKVLNSGRTGEHVTVSGHPSDTAAGKDVASRISVLVAGGARADSIAVLGRTRRVLDILGEPLLRSGVPYRMQAGNAFLERREVGDVMAYLKLAVDPTLDIAFVRILSRPARWMGASAAKAVLQTASERKAPIHEALAWCADSGAFDARASKGAAAMARNLSALSGAFRSGEPSAALVRYVMDDVGYADWARGKKDRPRTLESSFASLESVAEETPDFMDFMGLASMSREESTETGGVHVGTVHGAKGREWDHVFAVSFEQGVLPSARAMSDASGLSADDDVWAMSGGGIEEERRVAHVLFTRARHTLHVSFCTMRNGGKRPATASSFLSEAGLDIPRVVQTFADAKAQRNAKGQPVKAKRAAYW